MPKYEPSHLKEMNTRIVFQQFRNQDSLFVNEIARTTNISVPTVMKIVDFLTEQELIEVEEQTSVNAKVGRKPNMLRLKQDKYFSIGVIYEGDYLILGVVDLRGNVLNFLQLRCGQRFETSIFQDIDRLLEMSGRTAADLIGIGIGIPCIFDMASREITAPLIGIHEPKYFGDVIDRLSAKYGAKVIIDNDLNIQAFGEFASYKPPRKEDLIFISLGTGLGAGVILDGKVRRGNRNICGEIGYMLLEYPEDKAASGRLEEKINLNALKEKFNITDDTEDEKSKADAVSYVSDYLALIIHNLIFCYDASNVVLDGHVLELLGDGVIEQTQTKLDRICFRPVQIRKKNIASPGISGGALLASNAWLEELFK